MAEYIIGQGSHSPPPQKKISPALLVSRVVLACVAVVVPFMWFSWLPGTTPEARAALFVTVREALSHFITSYGLFSITVGSVAMIGIVAHWLGNWRKVAQLRDEATIAVAAFLMVMVIVVVGSVYQHFYEHLMTQSQMLTEHQQRLDLLTAWSDALADNLASTLAPPRPMFQNYVAIIDAFKAKRPCNVRIRNTLDKERLKFFLEYLVANKDRGGCSIDTGTDPSPISTQRGATVYGDPGKAIIDSLRTFGFAVQSSPLPKGSAISDGTVWIDIGPGLPW